jgi:predicted metal-dependent phosphoesterase TrpH
MVEKLRAAGVDIDDDDVGIVPGDERYLGRNRIASVLVRKGLVKDRLKAFKKWLNPGGRYFVEPEVVSAAEAVEAVKKAGGLAVLAHPTEDDLDRHLEPLLDCGIEGIELWRPRLQGSLLQRTEKEAKLHGLLASGGSDWHGLYPSVPLGEWKIDPEKVRELLARISR